VRDEQAILAAGLARLQQGTKEPWWGHRRGRWRRELPGSTTNSDRPRNAHNRPELRARYLGASPSRRAPDAVVFDVGGSGSSHALAPKRCRGVRGGGTPVTGFAFRPPNPYTAARTPGARESMLCAYWAWMLRPTLAGLHWCVGVYAVRGADGRSQCAAVRWRIRGALQDPRA
jgi:hypothetical protein